MLAYRKLVKLLVTPSYASNNQILSKYIFYFMEYFSLVIKVTNNALIFKSSSYCFAYEV